MRSYAPQRKKKRDESRVSERVTRATLKGAALKNPAQGGDPLKNPALPLRREEDNEMHKGLYMHLPFRRLRVEITERVRLYG